MIYIVVLILILIGVYKYDLVGRNHCTSKSAPLYYAIAFILFFIAAFRYYNGGDTKNYVELFRHIPQLSELSEYHFDQFRYQKGYIYFVAFVKELCDNFLIQQFITALIVNVVVFRFIKKYSPYIFLTTLIYFLLNYFEYNMEIMRECIAVAIGLLAYECWRARRYILMAVLIFVAYQIHVSALILITMPLFASIKFSKKSFAVMICIGIAFPAMYMSIPNLELYATMLFSQEDWVNDAYLIQEYSDTLSTNYYITHILRFLIIPFSLVWIVNQRSKFEYTGLIYAYALLQLLSMFSYAFYRFANYFAPFYWIVVACGVYILLARYRQVRSITLVMTLLLFLYLHQNIQLSVNLETNQYLYQRYYPYKCVLFEEGY